VDAEVTLRLALQGLAQVRVLLAQAGDTGLEVGEDVARFFEQGSLHTPDDHDPLADVTKQALRRLLV
jgi:hypothetical protein